MVAVSGTIHKDITRTRMVRIWDFCFFLFFFSFYAIQVYKTWSRRHALLHTNMADIGGAGWIEVVVSLPPTYRLLAVVRD